MGGFYPFVGFSFLFWVAIGLLRYLSENAYIALGLQPGIEYLKRFVKRHTRLFDGLFGIVGVGVGFLISYGGFVLFVLVTGIAPEVTSLGSLAPAYSSIAAWTFFVALSGYIAARIETETPIASGILTGALFWLYYFLSVIIFNPSIWSTNLPGTMIVHELLLAHSAFFAFLGASMGSELNNDDRQRRAFMSTVNLRRIQPPEVAAIIAAHNEEKTIVKAIESLSVFMPVENIFVGSDASTDNTVEVARSLGATVLDIQPNRGKANVLALLIEEHRLTERFTLVMIVDADSEVGGDYFENALPIFDDPDVAAVAVHALSHWSDEDTLSVAGLIRSYRVRFYRMLQATFRYGQTWKYTNSSPIVPGFASMYRSSALRHIAVNAPGLVIEDFNMTFEIYHKKLGIVAYSSRVHGVSKDPLTFRDYVKQVQRWNLGLWQTVRRHGFWPSFFSVSLFLFLTESMIASVFIVIAPLFFLLQFLAPTAFLHVPYVSSFSIFEVAYFAAALFVITDYLMTVVVALYEKKPVLLLNGFAFIVFRYIDALVFLYALPLAFFTKSDGRWISPKR